MTNQPNKEDGNELKHKELRHILLKNLIRRDELLSKVVDETLSQILSNYILKSDVKKIIPSKIKIFITNSNQSYADCGWNNCVKEICKRIKASQYGLGKEIK